MSSKKNQLLVILGPTATSKTDLALSLAKKFNGELISADSRQVYKGLDIGTGKIPGKFKNLKMENGRWIVNGILIYLYDVINPKKQYTVYDFVKDATDVINKISSENKLPIIVGGTGLYIRAFIDGLPNLGIPTDLALRKKLEKLSLAALQQRLQEISIKRWELMNISDRQNPRRLIRAIEIASGPKASSFKFKKFNILKIGLTTSRDVLYKRIDERVVKRINCGMIDEAKKLHEAGLSFKRMRQLGLEYGVLADFLEKRITKDELIKILQGKIHSFARHQLTWFKKEKVTDWFDITEKNYMNKVENLVAEWYHQANAAQD